MISVLLPHFSIMTPMKIFTDHFFNLKKNEKSKFIDLISLHQIFFTLFFLFLFQSNSTLSQTIRYASQQDVTDIPNASVGDLLVTGGTSTSNGLPAIYISATSNWLLAPGNKILIKGGVYDWISINNTSSGTAQSPIIITNYGGQVETKEFGIRGLSFFKLTGKYDSLQKTGDVNYKGHIAGYAWSQGKYGIFVNNKWSNQDKQLLEIRGDVFNGVKVHSTDFEVEFVESGNGGYSNAFRWDDITGNYAILDNIKIHDCYFHDMSGEGVYFGASEDQPAYELLKNLKIYNNRFIRCGRDAHQTKRTITGLRINNNVVVNPGMQGQDSQNFACNILFNDGNSIVENNIYVANPGYSTIQFFPSCDPIYLANGGTVSFRNNAMLHPGVKGTEYEGANGFFMNIYQCDSVTFSLPPVAIEISDNYWGKFSPTSVGGTNIVNSYYEPSLLAPVYARNNIFDGTGNKTTFWPAGKITSPTTNENNVIAAVPEAEFIDYEIGAGFSYDKFDLWHNLRNYDVGWYTTLNSKIYKAIDTSFGVKPGVSVGWETSWQLQTYNNGTSFFPADDVRLKPGKYKTLGMGLLDSVTSIPPSNIPPNAIAGVDQTITLPVSSVTLTGYGTDVDGTIDSYKWNKIIGPAQFTVVSSTTAQTSVNGLVQGDYVFELVVTDNNGAMGKDTVQVTVNAALNILPKAITGTDQTITLPVSSVTLTGFGTDADGTIASYKWNKISGPAQFTIVSSTLAQTAMNGLVQGVYVFELVVTDNNGAMGKDTVQVTVNAALNILPKAIAGTDQTITLPKSSVTLIGSGTDADGTIASYKWNKIAGPAQFTIVSPNAAQTVVNGLVQGVYAFELVATDNNGAFGKDTIQVTVNAALNISPKSLAGTDQTITLPVSSVTLTGFGTDADGTIASYKWNKISGPAQFTIVSSTLAQTAMNGLVQGVYAYELVVTDNNGSLGRDTLQVNVLASNTIPVDSVSVKLFPNPATSNIYLSFTSTKVVSTLKIQIYSSKGVIVWSKSISNAKSIVDLNVNISSYAKGTYDVKFVSNNSILKSIQFLKL